MQSNLTALNRHGDFLNVDVLATLTALSDLDLSNCWGIENVDGLSNLLKLRNSICQIVGCLERYL
jgi:hypothetical protein